MRLFELVTLFNALYIVSLQYKISNEDIKRFKSLYLQAFKPDRFTGALNEKWKAVRDNLDKSLYASKSISDRTYYFELCRTDFIELINSLVK